MAHLFRGREVPSFVRPFCGPYPRPIHKITVEKTEASLIKMKAGKTIGSVNFSIHLWKFWYAKVSWVVGRVFQPDSPGEEMPKYWHRSTRITICKKKGSLAVYSNNRLIGLFLHNLTIFERILDRRFHEIVKLYNNHHGFVAACGSTCRTPCCGRASREAKAGASYLSRLEEGF